MIYREAGQNDDEAFRYQLAGRLESKATRRARDERDACIVVLTAAF